MGQLASGKNESEKAATGRHFYIENAHHTWRRLQPKQRIDNLNAVRRKTSPNNTHLVCPSQSLIIQIVNDTLCNSLDKHKLEMIKKGDETMDVIWEKTVLFKNR